MKRAEKHRKQIEKQQAAANAFSAVGRHERYLEDIVSYHKTINSAVIDWQSLKDAAEPIEPTRTHPRETAAAFYLENYRPNFLIRILRLVNFRIKWLKRKVEKAKNFDEQEFQNNLSSFQHAHSKWKNDKQFAERILAGDIDSYVQLIKEKNPFNMIHNFSGDITFSFSDGKAFINIELNLDKNVPTETATYLKSGKVSIKDTPKTKYYTLCQDHVCSIALRVALETFALIPLEFVYVNVLKNILDTTIGTLEMKPILSLKVPRSTVHKINFQNVDPSDCMANFVHNMDFKKNEGFGPVSKVA